MSEEAAWQNFRSALFGLWAGTTSMDDYNRAASQFKFVFTGNTQGSA